MRHTRDQTLHRIERLARRSGRSEREVAQALLRAHARRCRRRARRRSGQPLAARRGPRRAVACAGAGCTTVAALARRRAPARAAGLPGHAAGRHAGPGGLDAVARRPCSLARWRRVDRHRRRADAVPGLRSGGRVDQPPDQRIDAAAVAAAAGAGAGHPAAAPGDGGGAGDAERRCRHRRAAAPPAAAPPGQSGTERTVRAAVRLERRGHAEQRIGRRAAAARTPGHPRAQPSPSVATRRGAALRAAAPRPGLQRIRTMLDRLGAQARQARGADRAAGRRRRRPLPGPGRRIARGRRHGLRRHAGQRHAAAAGAAARAGRRGRASAEPAARGCGRAARGRRLRHPAAAHRHALAGAAADDGLPLAVCRAVRHRPLQRRQLRGLPGPVRRRQLHRQGPAATCRRCTRCWPAACPKAGC